MNPPRFTDMQLLDCMGALSQAHDAALLGFNTDDGWLHRERSERLVTEVRLAAEALGFRLVPIEEAASEERRVA